MFFKALFVAGMCQFGCEWQTGGPAYPYVSAAKASVGAQLSILRTPNRPGRRHDPRPLLAPYAANILLTGTGGIQTRTEWSANSRVSSHRARRSEAAETTKRRIRPQ